MEALFACTKCHSRHPFEELSGSEQLCKDCRSNYPVVKCTYCRSEFQQIDKANTNSICKKCAYNVKIHGKPSACVYCTVIAAFIGNKCQRCNNSEKKFGKPQMCDQCKQPCAFDRKDDSQKKMDGKLLCWLCSKSYKKILAKSWIKGGGNGQESMHNTPLSSNGNTPRKATPTLPANNGSGSQLSNSKDIDVASIKEKYLKHRVEREQSKKSRRHERKRSHDGKRVQQKEEKRSEKKESRDDRDPSKVKSEQESSKAKENGDGAAASKKAKVERANGAMKTSPSTSSFNDFSGSEHIVIITQLREEVEALKKQSSLKEQTCLEKDRKITELKARNFEAEKEMRGKVLAMTKQHTEAIEALRIQNRELQRQVALKMKSNRKADRVASLAQSNTSQSQSDSS